MIHKYSPKSLNQWTRGELKVQIMVPGLDRPIAYCDGTAEDEAALADIAEAEGAELPEIHRRVLKTGREIWTMGQAPPDDGEIED